MSNEASEFPFLFAGDGDPNNGSGMGNQNLLQRQHMQVPHGSAPGQFPLFQSSPSGINNAGAMFARVVTNNGGQATSALGNGATVTSAHNIQRPGTQQYQQQQQNVSNPNSVVGPDATNFHLPQHMFSAGPGTGANFPATSLQQQQLQIEQFQPLAVAQMKEVSDRERRRHERNMREQQRSLKISQQIKELRTVLQDANVTFKPNKFSILQSVAEYIQELQSRIESLDSEHEKLLVTIRETTEAMNNPSDNIMIPQSTVGNDIELLAGNPDIDHKLIFDQASTAFAIMTLDGRLLDINTEFRILFDLDESNERLSKIELGRTQIFQLVTLDDPQSFFHSLGQMMKDQSVAENSGSLSPSNSDDSNGGKADVRSNSNGSSTSSITSNDPNKIEYWSGTLSGGKYNMNVSITRDQHDGSPKFMICAISLV